MSESDEAVPAMFLRTSERKAFQSCQQKWWWGYREGLVPRGMPADPLWFGIGVHISLAEWYCGPGTKRGPHPAETWEKYAADAIAAMRVDVAGWSDEQETKWVDLRELGRILMEEYVKHYGRDEQKLYIKAEMPFALDVPWPKDQALYVPTPTGLLLRYFGTTDGVWRHADTGQIWLDETKTERTIRRAHLALDNQGGSYWAVLPRYLQAMGLLSAKEKIAGIEYNFIRKGLPDDRPKDAEGYATNKPTKADYVEALSVTMAMGRQRVPDLAKLKLDALEALALQYRIQVLGARSKIQPPPLFDRVEVHRTSRERATQLRRIQEEGLHMLAVRDGILPVTKNPGNECNFCPFVDMCELQEQGGNWEDMKKAAYEVRDPYADHR